MSSVVITVTEPGGSPLDITSDVVFNTASFDLSMNAVPGSFSFTVRDPEQTHEFHTGWEILLTIDGITMFGGYVTQVSMTHFAEAADTSDIPDYDLRAWALRGTDYNIIFDRRVWRNTSDYLHFITLTEATDGELLRRLVDDFADLSDFDSSGIENIATLDGDVVQQGNKIRVQFENYSFFGGAVWYIAPDKTFIYKPFETVEKRWGFADDPNHASITASPASYQGATIGFRQVEGVEDGSYIQNDALIWGGSEFAGSSGGTVFSRTEDATSESTYGRWQIGETHFGETHYKTQAGVDARSDVIVNGPPGADVYGQQKGLRYAQWQFTFTWFSVDVPLLLGVPDHVVPGDIVTIVMDVFDVTKLLPLRSLRTTFPDAFLTEDHDDRVVQFEGTFGLQVSDPFTLWRYIMKAQNRVSIATPTVVDSVSESTVYGASYSDAPSPATDGSTTVFTMAFGYISGTLQVYRNGLIQRPGVDFTESDNVAGEFTMSSPPLTTDNLYVVAATLES